MIFQEKEQPEAELPLHLLSVFGTKPRSSRLQILQAPEKEETIEVSWSQSQSSIQTNQNQSEASIESSNQSEDRTPQVDEVSWSVSSSTKNHPGIVSIFSNNQLAASVSRVTTVSSALQFSIISTSTETSQPLFESTTITDQQRSDWSTQPDKPSDWTRAGDNLLHKNELVQSATPSLKRKSNEVSTASSNTVVTTDSTVEEDITTEAETEETASITDDNQLMTTSRNDDLQADESITAVYLHNSTKSESDKTKPYKDNNINSIRLVPFSKLTNHIEDEKTRKHESSTTRQDTLTENIYTVTPVYEAPTLSPDHYDSGYDQETWSPAPDTTLSPAALALMYSGQYHEENPGQYHEVNPGQYHEINPGQYHEVNPGKYILLYRQSQIWNFSHLPLNKFVTERIVFRSVS